MFDFESVSSVFSSKFTSVCLLRCQWIKVPWVVVFVFECLRVFSMMLWVMLSGSLYVSLLLMTRSVIVFFINAI